MSVIDVGANVGNPFAPLMYGISMLLHCMTASLAGGGAGLGAVWGTELARRLLAEAGFAHVDVVPGLRGAPTTSGRGSPDRHRVIYHAELIERRPERHRLFWWHECRAASQE